MIRQLSDPEWAWLCEKAELGSYIASTLVDELPTNLSEDFTFSNTQVMIKTQIKDTYLYYIFANDGLVNIMTNDGKIMIESTNEYELFKKFPEAAGITMKFYGMMEALFGSEYTIPLMTITDIKLRDAKAKKSELGSQIAMYNSYNTRRNAKIKHDLTLDYIMLYGKENLEQLSQEYHHTKQYIQVLNIIQETLMQSYVSRQMDEELEDLMSKSPTLVPDDKDPKIIHFIRPTNENEQ